MEDKEPENNVEENKVEESNIVIEENKKIEKQKIPCKIMYENEDDLEMLKFEEELNEQIEKTTTKVIKKDSEIKPPLNLFKTKKEQVKETVVIRAVRKQNPSTQNMDNNWEDTYDDLIKQYQQEEERKRKEEEAKQKVPLIEDIKETIEDIPVNVKENNNEEAENGAMISEFISKFRGEFDLRSIMSQYSDNNIEALNNTNSKIQEFIADTSDLQSGNLLNSHFTPYIDFSKDKLKHLMEARNDNIKSFGSDKDWKIFMNKLREKKSLSIKDNELFATIEGVIKDDKIENLYADNNYVSAQEIESNSKMNSTEKFKMLEERFLNINGPNKTQKNSMKKTQKSDGTDGVKLPKIFKKYKVNFGLIEKRRDISELEKTLRKDKVLNKESV